jgi:hypothetical protein
MSNFVNYLKEQQQGTIQPIESFKGNFIWHVKKPFMAVWYDFLLKENWVKKGAKMFYTEPNPNDKVEVKGFELAVQPHPGTSASQGARILTNWVADNLSEEEQNSLGYTPSTVSIAESFFKFYECPLTIPQDVIKKYYNSYQVDFQIALFEGAKNFIKNNKDAALYFVNPFEHKIGGKYLGMSYGVFVEDCEKKDITGFKEYKKYDIDQDVENVWVGALARL